MITLTWPMGQLWRSLATFLRYLMTQVLYVAPLFWFLELSQNVAWKWANGDWGWVYPASQYHWFSFGSIILWAGCVTLLWALHYFWFYPRRMKAWTRIAYGSIACWMGEWVGGYLAEHVFGHQLQVWPGSPLVYVSFSAIFFWLSNVIIYHLLTVNVADLTPAYEAPSEPEVGAETA